MPEWGKTYSVKTKFWLNEALTAIAGQSVMMISIGNKHYIETEHVVEILAAGNMRAEGWAHAAGSSGRLIDATDGAKSRSIVRLKSEHIVLTAFRVKTLKSRLGLDDPASATAKSGMSGSEHPAESIPPKFDDRRREPDRRRFSYTDYFPERRCGTERRSSHGKFQRERNP